MNHISIAFLLHLHISIVKLLTVFFFVVVFIIICQGSLLGFLLYSWANLYANVGVLTRLINWLTACENDKAISSLSAES